MIATLFRLARAWLDVKRIEKTYGVTRDEAKRIQSERLRRIVSWEDLSDAECELFAAVGLGPDDGPFYKHQLEWTGGRLKPSSRPPTS